MSTLAIPPKRVRLYRVLWDRWIIVLRILFDLGAGAHPVKWKHVADTLLVDKKTCQKYIVGLVRDGHLVLAGEGYMLTQAGMDVLLENEQGEFLPLEGKNTGEKIPLVVEVVNLTSSELTLTTPPTKLGKNPGEKFSPLAKLVFEHIPDIFDGSQLVTNGLPWADDDFQDTLLLSWVAYAYDKRTSLGAPVGLIYASLKQDKRPPVEYQRNYVNYLPDAFLDAVGLWRKTCVCCEEVFASKQVYDDHYHDCIANGRTYEAEAEAEEESTSHQVDTSALERLDGGKTMSPAMAWDSVLGQLQFDMPRASYDTWVRDTKAVRYANGTLTIGGVRNAYAVSWLESRLTSTVERLLVGILNRSVKVVFVVTDVAVETEVGNDH